LRLCIRPATAPQSGRLLDYFGQFLLVFVLLLEGLIRGVKLLL
jgi:hypothetical protein